MSIIEKIATLTFEEEPLPLTTHKECVSADWQKFLFNIPKEPAAVYEFFQYLANSGLTMTSADCCGFNIFGKRIVLDSAVFQGIPPITIEINPQPNYPDGSALLEQKDVIQPIKKCEEVQSI